MHPIPRRAINNIPILDTIHLEINRQPIGKPGQIDFEIDNLRSLARALTRLPVHSFVLSSRSTRPDSFSGERQAAVTGVESIKMPSHSRSRLSLRREIRLLNHNAINRYCDKRVMLNYNILCDLSSISHRIAIGGDILHEMQIPSFVSGRCLLS